MRKYNKSKIINFNELRVIPDATYCLPVHVDELAFPMESVSLEVALVVLVIGQDQLTEPFLRIAHEGTIVVLPLLLNVLEAGVVKCALNGCRLIIVDLPVAVELVHEPVSLVGQLVVRIVQPAEPMHVVVLPVPVIVAAFLVVELSLAVPQSVNFLPLIPTSIFILLHDILPILILVLSLRLLIKFGNDGDVLPVS